MGVAEIVLLRQNAAPLELEEVEYRLLSNVPPLEVKQPWKSEIFVETEPLALEEVGMAISTKMKNIPPPEVKTALKGRNLCRNGILALQSPGGATLFKIKGMAPFQVVQETPKIASPLQSIPQNP